MEEEPAVDPLRVLVSEVKSYLLVRHQQLTVLFSSSPADEETNICQSNTKSFERSLHETHVRAQDEAEGLNMSFLKEVEEVEEEEEEACLCAPACVGVSTTPGNTRAHREGESSQIIHLFMYSEKVH